KIYNNSSTDIFLAKIDPNGNWLWADQLGGCDDHVTSSSIAVNDEDRIAIGGYFEGTVHYGVDSASCIMTNLYTAMMGYGTPPVNTSDQIKKRVHSSIVIPNPIGQLGFIETKLNGIEESRLEIYDSKGRLVFTKAVYQTNSRIQIETIDYSPGIYFYSLEQDDVSLTSVKFVVY
ncbi:MAG: T9SS type A sorting domain-containing protein, partial [Bacteroidetes bacterium]|nr:T9SS type A sorting domain-containing protein [Bacteroidota bacterium]